MTDEIEISISEAKPGDMVWLKPFVVDGISSDDGERIAINWLGIRIWFATNQIHCVTRPISEVDKMHRPGDA